MASHLHLSIHSSSGSVPPSPTLAEINDISQSLATFTARPPSPVPERGEWEFEEWDDIRKGLESDLRLCAEIGQSLLERLTQAEAAQAPMQIQLEESIQRIASLEKDNENLMTKLSLSSRENSQRLLQSMTSLSMAESSIAALRAELSTSRGALSRQASAQARSTGWEDRLKESDRRASDLKDELEAERKKRLEADRKLFRAKSKTSDLENKLHLAKVAIERANQSKEEAALEVAIDAKARLAQLQQDLSNPGFNHTEEVQTMLDSLVSDNILLKKDNEELRNLLVESRQTIASRSGTPEVGHGGNTERPPGHNRSTSFLSDDLNRSTSSQPSPHPFSHYHSRKDSWAPSLHQSTPSGSFFPLPRAHGRNDSWTPSIASSASFASNKSPGGPEGEAPSPTSRTFGIPYVSAGSGASRSTSNGTGPNQQFLRGHPKRSFSMDHPRAVHRAFSGVGSIAEWTSTDDAESGEEPQGSEVFSPSGDESFGTTHKRTSIRRASAPSLDDSLGSHQLHEQPSTTTLMQADETKIPSPEKIKHLRKRPMLLLSKSRGVQTEPWPTDEVSVPASGQSVSITNLDSSSYTHSHREISDLSFASSAGGGSIASSPRPEHRTMIGTGQGSSFSYGVESHSNDSRSEASSLHQDTRTGSLATILEHMNRLLSRVNSADVPTLTRRLRRQHLPGDVSHLSKSTINSILTEVGDLRHNFKIIWDAEKKAVLDQQLREKDEELGSLVTRKDFLTLVKLFKEVFTELTNLKGVVNECILDPSMAMRLRNAAMSEADDDDDSRGRTRLQSASKGATGIGGWISNPISKFFITPPVDGPTAHDTSSSTHNSLQQSAIISGSRLQPPLRSAPKLAAATEATVATVNVEFASSGVVRRAVSTVPPKETTSGLNALPPSPVGTLSEFPKLIASLDYSSSGPVTNSLTAPTPNSSNRGTSPQRAPTGRPKANRDALSGIFAGATPSSRGGWVVIDDQRKGLGISTGLNNPPKSIRSTSSQIFRSPANLSGVSSNTNLRNPREAVSSNRLSAAVDAVLDPSLGSTLAKENPPLLERQLRPRGLSDSSIRSTFTAHGQNPSSRLISNLGASVGTSMGTVTAQAERVSVGNGFTRPDLSMIRGIGKRLWELGGATVTTNSEAATSTSSPPTSKPASLPPVSPSRSEVTTASESKSSPPRAIPPSASLPAAPRSPGASTSFPSSSSLQKPGILSGLASWATTGLEVSSKQLPTSLEDGEDEGNLRSASRGSSRFGNGNMIV